MRIVVVHPTLVLREPATRRYLALPLEHRQRIWGIGDDTVDNRVRHVPDYELTVAPIDQPIPLKPGLFHEGLYWSRRLCRWRDYRLHTSRCDDVVQARGLFFFRGLTDSRIATAGLFLSDSVGDQSAPLLERCRLRLLESELGKLAQALCKLEILADRSSGALELFHRVLDPETLGAIRAGCPSAVPLDLEVVQLLEGQNFLRPGELFAPQILFELDLLTTDLIQILHVNRVNGLPAKHHGGLQPALSRDEIAITVEDDGL